MKRMADVQKSYGGGQAGDDAIRRQFKIGAEVDASNRKIQEATRYYNILRKTMDENVKDPGSRARIAKEMDLVADKVVKETNLRNKLNRSIAEEGVEAGRSSMIRRGLKLGLATLGVPYTIAGIARGLQESNAQSQDVTPMAARMYGNTGSGGPSGDIKSFSEYSMRLRENIVDAGAAMAYGGRESIQLADSLMTMSGSMKGYNTALEASRALGISPQATISLLGTARRTGGMGGGMDEEKLVRLVTRGISETGMGPRGAEYINSIVSTMQQYSTRLPGNLDMGMISGVIEAVNAQAAKSGAPNLLGSGALQVTQGLTSMMDDQSEAMIAIQTEIVSKNKGDYAGSAKRYGLDINGSPLALVQALKSEGLASTGGLKLARETIKYVTNGIADENAKKYEQASLMRLSIPMFSALDKGGQDSFMKWFMNSKDLNVKDFEKRIGGAGVGGAAGNGMDTPGMSFKRVASDIGALVMHPLSDANAASAPVYNAVSERIESIMKKDDVISKTRERMLVGGGALVAMGATMSATGVGAALGLPTAAIGAGLMAAGYIGKGPGDTAADVFKGMTFAPHIYIDVHGRGAEGGWTATAALESQRKNLAEQSKQPDVPDDARRQANIYGN